MKKKIVIAGGARPNFIKIVPLIREFKRYKKHFDVLFVHTGQHYDFTMSEIFFQDLCIPKPDVFLNAGSSSHAIQTAKIMMGFERVLIKEKPDLIVVVGDVNSTLACSFVASKLNIKIAHVESGLRSFDKTMPEEINRIVTDSLSDYLFVTEKSGMENLKKEGIDKKKIFFVGNVMIDTLLLNMRKIDKSDILKQFSLRPDSYGVLTLHRPSNVDTEDSFLEIYAILKSLLGKIRIIYPVHPRSMRMMRSYGILGKFKKLNNLCMTKPLGYVDFIKLIKKSSFVLTDSGGIQEEAAFMRTSCLTLRENTERPATLKGTNYLVGRNKDKILRHVKNILNGKIKDGKIPELWDGKAARRIAKILI